MDYHKLVTKKAKNQPNLIEIGKIFSLYHIGQALKNKTTTHLETVLDKFIHYY